MRKKGLYLLLLPGVLFLTLFMVIPIAMTIASTFFHEGSFTLQGYMQFLTDKYFVKILLTTLQVSLVTTIACIVLGFPAAYYISKLGPRKKGFCWRWPSSRC